MDNYTVIKNKIVKRGEELDKFLKMWKLQNKKIVFTNGCFDILHKGHVEYLSKASNFGDVMVLGLNSDSSVKRLKGESRPLQDESSRAMVMASLQVIDLVVVFDEETPYGLIKEVQPDVLVKGADYKPENIVGYDILIAKGGEVKTVDLTDGYSTTSVIQKMK